MKYSEAITDILARTDESYTGAPIKARARVHFRGAITTLIMKGEYSSEDVLGLVLVKKHVFDAGDDGELNIATEEDLGDNVLRVKDIFLDAEDDEGLIFSEVSLAEMKRYSFSPDRRPKGKSVKWYKIGKTIRFIPRDTMEGLTVYFIVVTTPPEWDASDPPIEGCWYDTTELLEEMSFGFLLRAIVEAKRTLEEEME